MNNISCLKAIQISSIMSWYKKASGYSKEARDESLSTFRHKMMINPFSAKEFHNGVSRNKKEANMFEKRIEIGQSPTKNGQMRGIENSKIRLKR